jgi:hypothetical protein
MSTTDVIGACVPITSTDQPALTTGPTMQAHRASRTAVLVRHGRAAAQGRAAPGRFSHATAAALLRGGERVPGGPRALWRAAGLCPSASSSRSCRPAPRRLAPPSAEADRAADAPAVRVDRLLSKRGDGATARAFFSRAVSFGRRPGEVTTDRAPIYPRVLDDVVPSARHVVEQYANDVMEADPGPAQSEAGTDRVRRLRVTRDDRALGLGSSRILAASARSHHG